MARAEDHNCLFCGAFFRADARNAKHQKYCSEPACRQAIIAAREAWRNEPARLAHDAQGKSAQELEDLLTAAFDAFLVRLSRWPDEEEGE